MTNYNDGNWHGWNGGECPVHPESVVDAVWHDENQLTTGVRHGRALGGAWFNQILKFRVVKEHREPKEYTIDPRKNIIWYSSEDDLVHVKELDK